MPIRLNTIITRTGDDGSTGLSDGSRLPKDHALIVAIGSVDEANTVLGMVRLEVVPDVIAAELPRIQNDLFDLGSDLATPPGGAHEAKIPRIAPSQIARLEAAAAAANAGLAPLTSFVLPGGARPAAWMHMARVAVRRAEREVVAATHALPSRAFNPEILRYLNRLSDLCFIWARQCNGDGAYDVLWAPGRHAR